VTVRGPIDPETGMAVDMAELKRVVTETVLARFDHAFVNEDPAFPPGVLPTTENLVRVAWDLLVAKLGADRIVSLRLWEDPTLYVDYRGEA
jgi:6-pyruvoyltetrahydropterin/6-carboxytetrahydropterin synthase